MACALIVSTAFCLPFAAVAKEAQTRTVMLYIVGSNLESNCNSATVDLAECMCSEYNENVTAAGTATAKAATKPVKIVINVE